MPPGIGIPGKYYVARTLVDITNSGNTDSLSQDRTSYNQEQNLNVLLQIIGLRAQPTVVSVSSELTDVDELEFGDTYSGQQRVWTLVFTAEYEGAWKRGDNTVFHLLHDSNDIAITSDLTETADVGKTFDTTASGCNLYFKYMQNIASV